MAVYAVIEKQRNQATPTLNQRKVTLGRLSIRWAIVGLCIFLATSYFTLVPSGKALAASIAKVIVQIFDGGFLYSPTSTPVLPQDGGNAEDTITSYADFDEVEKVTGHKFIQIDSVEYTLTDLQFYDGDYSAKRLYAFYETYDGLTISLYQKWDMHVDYWSEVSIDDSVWEEHLADSTTVYCSINSEDKTFTAEAVWNDTVVTIYADEGIPYTEVLASIYLPNT